MHTTRIGKIRFHHNGGFDGDVIINDDHYDTKVPVEELIVRAYGYVNDPKAKKADRIKFGDVSMTVYDLYCFMAHYISYEMHSAVDNWDTDFMVEWCLKKDWERSDDALKTLSYKVRKGFLDKIFAPIFPDKK